MKSRLLLLCSSLSIFFLLVSSFGVSSNGTVKNVDFYGNKTELIGNVRDEQGKPIPGVTVTVKGTNTGTITDDEGSFRLSVNKGQIIVFSSIGYQVKELKYEGQSKIDVTLEASSVKLNEFVAIGYGSVLRKDLTGAVSSIKGEDLMDVNPISINHALQGKIAGVVVSQSDGAPGAGVSIQIRGGNSFSTSTEPLYVIDGVPFNGGKAPQTDYGMKQENNPLNLINPKDVESIEVLKDASATAIYGSRGANGVILITTKSGKIGENKVEVNSRLSLSEPVRVLDVLSAATFAEYRNEQERFKYTYDGGDFVAEENLPYPIPGKWSYTTIFNPETGREEITDSTYNPSPQDFRDGYLDGGTNWQDQIFHTAVTHDFNIRISGGSEKGSYSISLEDLDQQGVIQKSYYKRNNLSINLDRNVTNWFSFSNYLTASKSDNRLARTNTETYGIIPSAIGFNPTRSIFDPDEPSGVSMDFSTGLSNPYLYVRTAKNLVKNLTINNTSRAKIKFFEFLSFQQDLSYYHSNNERELYYNRFISGGVSPTNGYGAKYDNYYTSLTLQSTLNFNKSLGSSNRLNGVLGYTYEQVDWGGKQLSGSNFPNDINENNSMGDALLQNPFSSSRGRSSLVSFLGRVNYSLLDKYLATVSFRRDGSSRLSKLGRWANFYSFALAWRLSEEAFIKDIDFIDDLKLRGGYGETGNQSIAAYATQSRMTNQNYTYNGELTSGYAEDRWGGPAAPNLHWETTRQANIGLDATLFNNRLNLVLDFYRKNTFDLLQNTFIPYSTGFSSIPENSGRVINKGVELAGSFRILNQSSLGWEIKGNISFDENRIEDLESDQFSDVAYGIESMFLRRNGHPIGTLYGFKEDGFYDNEAEVRADPAYRDQSESTIRSMIGQVKYKDINNDGVIDNRDKIILGSTSPDFTYGVTNTFYFKDWTFSFFFQGLEGNDILNVNLHSYDMAGTTNMPKFVWDNRWTPENRRGAEFPRSDITYTRSLKASDRLLEDGSFLRLRNISLGYLWNYPIKEIESLNLSFSINNLFTITKYRWYDPDVNSFGSDPARRGVDMASYPSARTYTLNLGINF